MARELMQNATWVFALLALLGGASSSSSSLSTGGLQLCVHSKPSVGTSLSALPGDCKPVRPEQQATCKKAAQNLVEKCQLASASNATGDVGTEFASATTATVAVALTATGTPSPADSPAASTLLPSTCREVEYIVRHRLCDDHSSHVDGVNSEESKALDDNLNVSAIRQAVHYRWAGAIGSVLAISLAGFGILSLVPLLSKVIYKSLLQFLVALAIGTLVGDAVLHLLPHALLSSSHGTEHAHADADGHDHDHGHSPDGEIGSSSSVTWRASMALVGVLVFYNAERLLGVFTQKKADHDREHLPHQSHSCNDGCESRPTECDSCGELGVVVGHSSTEMKSMVKTAHENLHALSGVPCHASADGLAMGAACTEVVTSAEHTDVSFGAEPLLGVPGELGSRLADAAPELSSRNGLTPRSASKEQHSTSELRQWTPCQRHQHHAALGEVSEKHLLAAGARNPPILMADPVLIKGDDDGHGHSHHFHPSSMSSVAYMVVAGDGMHNFTDGLAIGVAFSGSLAGGLGTAIAVLCHELPHELGDFAMLLKAGMSIKQAFVCNVISAALCLTGSVIGVAVGSVSSDGEQWLFGFCGGIFLYIALVDMMPEISRVEKNRPLLQLLIQDLGLLTGFCVMLTIALFEHSIEKAITWHMPQL